MKQATLLNSEDNCIQIYSTSQHLQSYRVTNYYQEILVLHIYLTN